MGASCCRCRGGGGAGDREDVGGGWLRGEVVVGGVAEGVAPEEAAPWWIGMGEARSRKKGDCRAARGGGRRRPAVAGARDDGVAGGERVLALERLQEGILGKLKKSCT